MNRGPAWLPPGIDDDLPQGEPGVVMLDALRFRNYKALADVRVPLARFTVLVGPNACGKTSVLRGADLLGALWKPDSVLFRRDEQGFWLRKWGGRSFDLSKWRSDASMPEIEIVAESENSPIGLRPRIRRTYSTLSTKTKSKSSIVILLASPFVSH